MTASRNPWPPSDDEYRRRLRSRVRYDRLWAPDEPEQLELIPVSGGPRHISSVLRRWVTSLGGTAIV